MLKIKDNVDLKVLEQYGFKPDLLGNDYIKTETTFGGTGIQDIRISKKDRIIREICSCENTIYDLITAGLVEKVGKR